MQENRKNRTIMKNGCRTAAGRTAARVKNTSKAVHMKNTSKAARMKIKPKTARMLQEWFRILVQIMFSLAAPSVYSAAFSAAKNALSAMGAGVPLEWTGFTVQFLAVVVYTILFGRFFCGWACAFGAVNDWIYRFSKWLQKKAGHQLPEIPERAAGILSKMKFAVLIGLLALCFFQRESVITANSPWTVFALLRARHFELAGNRIGIVLLLAMLVGMAFQERFFCRFFCPMGAIFALLPYIPFFHLTRHADQCPDQCRACKNACPVDLHISADGKNMGECIRCGRCSGICPKGNITSWGKLKGNEWWMDLAKAGGLYVLLWVLQV